MIILNYRPVLCQPTGIGVYANSILPALQKFDHQLIPGGGQGGVLERVKRLSWSQFQLPLLAQNTRARLIFTPAPEGYIGYQHVPQVLTVHDLRPLIHPERSYQSLYFRMYVPYLLRSCRHIVTNSKYTANSIANSIGIGLENISVIPLGYDQNHFYPKPVQTSPHKRPYLLHIGQHYPHKNLYRLIHAFRLISSQYPGIDLLLVGKPHPTETAKLQRFVKEVDLTSRVHFRRYATYNDLPDLYRCAIGLVYPSLWEGFGLPILESLACGTRVLTSYGSGTEEAANGNALLVDPLDIQDIAHGISRLINYYGSGVMSEQDLLSQGAKAWSWQVTGDKTYECILRLIE